jgi:hypothetical protein
MLRYADVYILVIPWYRWTCWFSRVTAVDRENQWDETEMEFEEASHCHRSFWEVRHAYLIVILPTHKLTLLVFLFQDFGRLLTEAVQAWHSDMDAATTWIDPFIKLHQHYTIRLRLMW